MPHVCGAEEGAVRGSFRRAMQLAAEARSKARFARAAAEGKRLTSSSGENEGVSPPSLTIVRAALAAHCPLSYFAQPGCRAACEPLAARAAPTAQALHTERLPGRERTAPSTFL